MIVSYELLKEKYPDATITVFSNNSINNKDTKSSEGYNLYIKELLGEDIQIIDWTYIGHFDLLVNGGGGVHFDNKPAGLAYFALNKLSRSIPISFIVKADRLLRNGFNRNDLL